MSFYCITRKGLASLDVSFVQMDYFNIEDEYCVKFKKYAVDVVNKDLSLPINMSCLCGVIVYLYLRLFYMGLCGLDVPLLCRQL